MPAALSRIDTPRARLLLLGVILLASSALRLHGLDHSYITLWDEAVHVNVVRNLVDDCCTPALHLRPYGTDAREAAGRHDWTDNAVWLHKPPVPFLFNAAVAAVSGAGLFGIRLASLLAAQCAVILVFWIGVRFFDTWTAVAAAILLGFNHYTFEMVQGRQFSGITDLTLTCALLGALYCLLLVAAAPSRRHYLGFGGFVGLAFLCKDGLALIPFVPLAALILMLGWRRHALNLGWAIAAALIVIVPPSLYLAARFPTEALLEQRERVAHLFRDLDGWGRPFDFYLTVYFPKITSPLITAAAYLGVGYALMQWRSQRALALLGLWVVSYLALLSLGVSKIQNFIYPIVPVVSLLAAAVVVRLWRRQQYRWLLAGAAMVALTAALLQWNVFNSERWLIDRPEAGVRANLLVFQGLALAIAVMCASRLQLATARRLAAVAVGLALALVLASSIRASWQAPAPQRRDYASQMALREAALALPQMVAPDDVVLVQWPGVRKSHLYVKFWSRVESFEVTDTASLAERLNMVRAAPSVYLLSELPGSSEPIGRAGSGYLYRLR